MNSYFQKWFVEEFFLLDISIGFHRQKTTYHQWVLKNHPPVFSFSFADECRNLSEKTSFYLRNTVCFRQTYLEKEGKKRR